MKLLLLVTFLSSTAYVTSAKKLLVVGGLNGGLATGLNGGLLGQGLVVGGVNPALFPAGATVIGQPPFAQMFPAVQPYMLQPPVAAAPFALPNPQAQFPQAMPFAPNAGLPFYPPMNRQVLPPQQQAVGMPNLGGNVPLPQGDMPAGPVPRFRRTLYRRMQDKSAMSKTQATPTPSTSKQPDV
ncbi:secretory calcium-binding phosphoprotein 9 [Brachyhypopomus gauderio]|uniref:secretory calcium-binding phosphoprotein 9 n=1 Tax=Brachyhypopomus gauderio TaxID=698409 RepID=UPI004041FF58